MARFVGASRNKGVGTPSKSANTAGRILTNDGNNDQWGGAVEFTSANTTLGPINANSTTVNTDIRALEAISALGGTVTFANNTALPGNLTLNANTGAITGSNSGLIANSYTFDVTATESKYGGSTRRTFTLVVDQTNGIPIWSTPTTVANTTTYITQNSTIQFTATAPNSIAYSIANTGTLPNGSAISSSGLLTIVTNTLTLGTYVFTFTLRATDTVTSKLSTRTFSASVGDFGALPGQALFTGDYNSDAGQCTYTWVAPTGVTSVSVMAIGGGGGGYHSYWGRCAGTGGGSIWANCIPVTPGASHTIQVGRGGCWSGSSGAASCFPGLCAFGGSRACCNYGSNGCHWCFTPGAFSGTHCGGFGMVAFGGTDGGGGAAGYCNGCCATHTPGHQGMGGGGGSGTSQHSSTYGSGGGGGTGINGMCCGGGAGACGNAGYSHQTGSGGQGGSGGTCGNPGEPWSNGQGNGFGCGGCYGGGGGGGGTSHGGGWGGPGAVRIIWGNGRCYPNTRTCNE